MRFVFMFLLLCPLWRDFLYVSISNICDTSSWTFLSPVDSLNYCVFLVAYYDGAIFFFPFRIEFNRTVAHTAVNAVKCICMLGS